MLIDPSRPPMVSNLVRSRTKRGACSHAQAKLIGGSDCRRSQHHPDGEVLQQQALQAGAVSVWDWRPGSNRLFLSRHFRQFLLRGTSGGRGLADWLTRVHEADLDRVLEAIGDCLSSRSETLRVEHRLRLADGGWRWYLTRAAVIQHADGRPARVAGTTIDIDDFKHRERALSDVLGQAEAASAAKSAQLADLSHELRTPMNSILGFGELLSQTPGLSAQQLNYLGHIMVAGEHLMSLINDVLDLARIEAGKLDLTIEPLSPVSLCEDCLLLAQVDAEAANVRLINRAAAHSLPLIRADGLRLKQVLLNLLTNAIKYGGANQDVTLDVTTTGSERVLFTVSDAGPGIPPHRLKDLFQPFSRLGDGTSPVRGTGIGLNLCKRLVELMGGRIGVISGPDAGSRFWFEIPAAAGRSEELAA